MAYCAYCGAQVAEVSYRTCPSCGNPANGAPRAAVPVGGSNPAVIIIAVIAGVLVLVMIVGILAAIAVPNLITAMQRSKQKRTMADMRAIATAVESYGNEHGRYPEATSASELARALEPAHLKNAPMKDGWERELRYECWTGDDPCDHYAIASAGKDGLFQHDSLREYSSGAVTDFDCDLVFANGVFVTHPPNATN